MTTSDSNNLGCKRIAMTLPRVSAEFPDTPGKAPVKPCRKRSIMAVPDCSGSPPAKPIRRLSVEKTAIPPIPFHRSIEMPEKEGKAPVMPCRQLSASPCAQSRRAPAPPSRKKSSDTDSSSEFLGGKFLFIEHLPPMAPTTSTRNFRYLRLSPVMPHRKRPEKVVAPPHSHSSDSSGCFPLTVRA